MAFVLCVYQKDCCWQLILDKDSNVTIGLSKNDSLYIPDQGFYEAHLLFTFRNGNYILTAEDNVFSSGEKISTKNISTGDVINCFDLSIFVAPKQNDYKQSVSLSINKEYILGWSNDSIFCFSNKRVGSKHAKFISESGRYKLIDLESKNHTFVNGKKISTHFLNDGDIITLCYFTIIYENGELSFFNTGNELKINLDENEIIRRYPLFRRSPRLGITNEYKQIEIEQPPHIEEKPQINWLTVILPPLVMAGVAVAIMFFSNGGLTNLLFILPMTIVTLFTTITSYSMQVRKFYRQQKQKTEGYDEYVKQKINEIEKAYSNQFYSINNTNPETEYCYNIVSNRMRRLWERSVFDDDFLEVRLGKGNLPLATDIILPKTAVGININLQLESTQNFINDLKIVKDVAIIANVKKNRTIGVVGNRQTAVKAMQNCVVQLTTQHSYIELNLIIISSERDYEKWAWTRWLPHIWDSERHTRYLSSDKKQATELLGYFEDVLKKRKDNINDDGYQEQIILPYYIFIITDYKLTENREILNLVSGMNPSGGVSAFLLFDSINNLPKECDLIIDFNNIGGSLYSRVK
ncbi:MAG: FHA domain-containing protein [Oscillospiraceae bacterium]|jgi:S-DNA-T family DNA segregation ATPase FtsK/SpoIIIE|nr:FHA domain-containing protein [Oscillospiraceae bacterium]